MPPAARKRSTAKAAPPVATQPATGTNAPGAVAALTSPFFSASLTLPGPGAAVKVGPLAVSMPTGYLYYAGLGVLAVAGTIEWPIAAALGAGGFVVNRIRNSNTSRSSAGRPPQRPAQPARTRPAKAT